MAALIAYLSPRSDHMTHLTSLCPRGQSIKWVDSNQPIEIQRDQLDGILSVIVSPSYYPVELARMTKSVKLVQTLSAGTDQIDKVTLGEMGIMVSNNGGGNAISVAEGMAQPFKVSVLPKFI